MAIEAIFVRIKQFKNRIYCKMFGNALPQDSLLRGEKKGTD